VADVVLTWKRFDTFRLARKRFRRVPCVYVLADKDATILRVGESDDMWQPYVGGAGWMVDAAPGTLKASPMPIQGCALRHGAAWCTMV